MSSWTGMTSSRARTRCAAERSCLRRMFCTSRLHVHVLTSGGPAGAQVNWEFWTNSNDMCGAVCNVQQEFIKVRGGTRLLGCLGGAGEESGAPPKLWIERR